jgi:hypothetical protein
MVTKSKTRVVRKVATLVKTMGPPFRGVAKVYKMSPPLQKNKYVVVSASHGPFSINGQETYIFGCDKNGKAVNWSELSGSFQGQMNHEKALRNAGYLVKE